MKRVCLAGAITLLTLICAGARAQDKQLFNHLSLGISVGLDGVGAQLALPVSPYVQLRAGYAIFPYTFMKSVEDFTWEGKQLEAFPVGYTAWKGGNGKFLLDIFPGKKTPFHLTAGVWAGPGKYVHWEAYLGDILEKEEYASVVYTYGSISFSTDAEGVVQADALMKRWVPYVGLGFGRAVRPGKRVSINADLGVLITGGTTVQTYNYVNNPAGEPVVLRSKDLVTPSGRQMDRGWTDRVSDWPVLPMLKIDVFFQLF